MRELELVDEPIVANFEFEIKGLWMRTWNLVLIAFVYIFVMAGSTQAQRVPRPILNRAPIYRGNLQPMFRPTTDVRISGYRTTSHRYPSVIARPEDRQWIREIPVELRPNRPMHFLGNSRRRTLR